MKRKKTENGIQKVVKMEDTTMEIKGVVFCSKREKDRRNKMKKRKVFFVGGKRKKMNEKEDKKRRQKN